MSTFLKLILSTLSNLAITLRWVLRNIWAISGFFSRFGHPFQQKARFQDYHNIQNCTLILSFVLYPNAFILVQSTLSTSLETRLHHVILSFVSWPEPIRLRILLYSDQTYHEGPPKYQRLEKMGKRRRKTRKQNYTTEERR